MADGVAIDAVLGGDRPAVETVLSDPRLPPLRPLVKVHPVTGRPALYIGRHAHAIPGLSADESRGLERRTCAPSTFQSSSRTLL